MSFTRYDSISGIKQDIRVNVGTARTAHREVEMSKVTMSLLVVLMLLVGCDGDDSKDEAEDGGIDSGSEMTDSGRATMDSGRAARDSGRATTDSGSGARDSGRDAGERDSSTVAEGGGADSNTEIDDGGSETEDDGGDSSVTGDISCGSSEAPSDCVPLSDTIGSLSIETDTTIAAGCYKVDDTIYISSGATLTVEPGVYLAFEQDTGVEVWSDGALSAEGTSDHPIVFTGATKMRGFWDGIILDNANSIDNKLHNVFIEYAGSSDVDYCNETRASLCLDSSGFPVRMEVVDSAICESSGYGIFFDGTAIVPSFDNNIITSNAKGPGFVFTESAHNLSDTSTYIGNDKDLLYLEGDYGLTTAQTWPGIDVPYLLHGAFIHDAGINLTIAPGTTIVFEQDSYMFISSESSLTAVGTASQPILFTGEYKNRGHWGGIIFFNSNQVENQFDYVTIEYGGGYDTAYGQPANLVLSSSGYDVTVTLTNSTIRESGGYGIWEDCDGLVEERTTGGNTVESNQNLDFKKEEGC